MQTTSIRLLTFSYISAVSMIILLMALSQGLIQWALQHQSHQRQVISLVNAQELRTERMFYNVILLQNPAGNGTDYAGLLKAIQKDSPLWEETQQAMSQGNTSLPLSPSDLSPSAELALAGTQKQYQAMDAALHHIYLLEQHHATPDQVRPDVDIFYLGKSPYQASLVSVYGDLVTKADEEVNSIKWIEASMAILMLIVLCCEAFLIIRPAILLLNKSGSH